MDAIQMLSQQHEQLDELLSKAAKARSHQGKEHLFGRLADALAIHTTLEETVLNPEVRARRTDEIDFEAVEEHWMLKRILCEMLDLDPDGPAFAGKLRLLTDEVEHHIEEQKRTLFPQVRRLIDEEHLERLAEQMAALMTALEGSAPRYKVRAEVVETADRD